jgi:hypothetical protein
VKAGDRGLFASSIQAGFLVGFFFDLKMESTYSSEMLPFNELHGVISQQIELSTTTAVITSNPTEWA